MSRNENARSPSRHHACHAHHAGHADHPIRTRHSRACSFDPHPWSSSRMAYMLMLLAGLIRAPGGQVRADARQPLGSAVQKMRPQEDVGTGSTSLKSDPMGTLADLVPSAPRTTRVDPGDLPPPVRVEQGAKAHLQLFAGLDARRFRYRPGTWNPVHVRIHNFSSEVLQGNLLVGTTGETMVDYDLDETKTTVQTVVEVPARQSKDFFLLINPEKGNGNLVAVLKDRERNQHMASPAFTGGGAALESGETRHIVVLQSDIVDQLIDQTSTERFQYLPRLLSQSSGRIRMSDVLVSHPLPRSLPRSWRGWSGADTIILSDPDVLDLIDDDQVGALESHVLTGGSLIVELASPADARALRAAVNRNPRARWILPPTVDFPADGALLQAPRNSLRTSSDSEKILQFLQEEHPGILAIRVKPTSPSIGEGTTRIESAPAAGDDVVVGEIPIRVVAPYGWGQRILFPLAIRDVPQKKDFPAGFGSFLIPTRNQESPINGPQSEIGRAHV